MSQRSPRTGATPSVVELVPAQMNSSLSPLIPIHEATSAAQQQAAVNVNQIIRGTDENTSMIEQRTPPRATSSHVQPAVATTHTSDRKQAQKGGKAKGQSRSIKHAKGRKNASGRTPSRTTGNTATSTVHSPTRSHDDGNISVDSFVFSPELLHAAAAVEPNLRTRTRSRKRVSQICICMLTFGFISYRQYPFIRCRNCPNNKNRQTCPKMSGC